MKILSLITRGVDSSHMTRDLTRTRVPNLMTCEVATRLDIIKEDLRLDLDFDSNDSRLDLDLRPVTRKDFMIRSASLSL